MTAPVSGAFSRSVSSSVASITAAGIGAAMSFTGDWNASVGAGRVSLVFARLVGTRTQNDETDHGDRHHNDNQSAQSARSLVSLHLKVINND